VECPVTALDISPALYYHGPIPPSGSIMPAAQTPRTLVDHLLNERWDDALRYLAVGHPVVPTRHDPANPLAAWVHAWNSAVNGETVLGQPLSLAPILAVGEALLPHITPGMDSYRHPISGHPQSVLGHLIAHRHSPGQTPAQVDPWIHRLLDAGLVPAPPIHTRRLTYTGQHHPSPLIALLDDWMRPRPTPDLGSNRDLWDRLVRAGARPDQRVSCYSMQHPDAAGYPRLELAERLRHASLAHYALVGLIGHALPSQGVAPPNVDPFPRTADTMFALWQHVVNTPGAHDPTHVTRHAVKGQAAQALTLEGYLAHTAPLWAPWNTRLQAIVREHRLAQVMPPIVSPRHRHRP